MGSLRQAGYAGVDPTTSRYYSGDAVAPDQKPLRDDLPERCWMVFSRDSGSELYDHEPWSTEEYAQARAFVFRRRGRETHVAEMALVGS